MRGKLTLEIVTPEKIVFSEIVDSVSVTTTEGEIGILPGHISLFSRLKAGELKYRKGPETSYLAINGGFVDVSNNKVIILADIAVRSEEIDQHLAEKARESAEKAMQESKSKKDFAAAEASLRRSLIELKVSQRKRKQAYESPVK